MDTGPLTPERSAQIAHNDARDAYFRIVAAKASPLRCLVYCKEVIFRGQVRAHVVHRVEVLCRTPWTIGTDAHPEVSGRDKPWGVGSSRATLPNNAKVPAQRANPRRPIALQLPKKGQGSIAQPTVMPPNFRKGAGRHEPSLLL